MFYCHLGGCNFLFFFLLVSEYFMVMRKTECLISSDDSNCGLVPRAFSMDMNENRDNLQIVSKES